MEGLPNRRTFLKLFSVSTLATLWAACTQQAPVGPKTSQPAASSPAADAATAPAGAAATTSTAGGQAAPAGGPPAQKGGAITLKFQSAFPQTDVFHLMSTDYVKKIDEMSGGRVKIDLLPNNAVVPFDQIIDAVSQGLLDGGFGVPAYWFAKNRAASLFGTGPNFGMDADEFMGWIHYGGGQALYDELIQQVLRLDVQSFFFAPMPTQPLGWFKRDINTPEDLRGLKYRTVGLSADLFKEMGVAVTILPGGEIVPSLERGVIDGAEFNNPSSDKTLGFADVSKTYMVQSYHQPAEFVEFMINKKKYDGMPADVKAVLRYGVMAQSADSTWKYFYDMNSKDLQELKSKGVKVVKTPRPILEAQLRAWDTIIARESQANPFFAKVIDSQKQWAQRLVPLRSEIVVDQQLARDHYLRG